jgi:Tol biopolymer transport system component
MRTVLLPVIFITLAGSTVLADTASQLTADLSSDLNPAWSPDGSLIAFESDRSGNYDIWAIPASGGIPVQITTNAADDHHPTWFPDGSLIAFHSDRSGNTDIWTIPASGGIAVQITASTYTEVEPAWSPDGSTIAYVAHYDPHILNDHIWLVPSAGGVPTQLTTAEEANPDWSPDGSRIAFTKTAPALPEIYTIPVEGGLATSVTGGEGFEGGPAWSPGGDEIAYHCDPPKPVGEPSNYDIYAVPSGGGPRRRITDDPAEDKHPDWSHDCTRIVFCSNRSGNWDLWIIEVGGPSATEPSTWGAIKSMYR